MARSSETPLRRIGLVLFDGVEELDAVGPWEVLAHWTQCYEEDGWSISTVSRSGDSVRAAKGLDLGAQLSFADAGRFEVLIHPGGVGTRQLMQNREHLEWIGTQRRTASVVASVCTGALVLAAAGLLRDRPATTYWGAIDELRKAEPSAKVQQDARWVDDGDLITAAGVSAGIDMALHMVARFAGPDRARQVKRGIEYSPAPPV